MAYDYKEIKPKIFTEANQRLFLEIRDKVHEFLRETGKAKMGFIIQGLCGDSWMMMACVDRLVELGEIKEAFPQRACAAQNRIFLKKEDK